MHQSKAPLLTLTLLTLVSVACGGDDNKKSDPPAATPTGSSMSADANTPPQTATEMKAWLDAGHYLDWNCESAPHSQRSPSPHGKNRICSNDTLSENTAALFPKGSAGVKELYTGDAITGYAVYLKVVDGDGGDKWYWYEILGSSVVADGLGSSGSAKSTCVSCHNRADNDQVFTQVK